MNNPIDILIGPEDHQKLMQHLFPGDGEEHGAILKAGVAESDGKIRLLIREVSIANEGTDYVPGKIGHRALTPIFIHKHIVACRDQRLAYIAVHNHNSDDRVGFSRIDIASHERGYPALLDIVKGMPVGALVLGARSAEADIWLPDGSRRSLNELRVIGSRISRFTASPPRHLQADNEFERQSRMFGDIGQSILKQSTVAIIGLGGIGSIVAEYLGRLGVGRFILIDPDHIERSNLSRVVGATQDDVNKGMLKIEIAKRQINAFDPRVEVKLIPSDVSKCKVAKELRVCDYIFLAADSMRARLVINAIVHQYMIPAVQLGAKIRKSKIGGIEDAMSAIRSLRPGVGCLWCNQLIDPTLLAIKSKSDFERSQQAYGTQQPNPSVITMNAISGAHAVNDFLFDFLGLRPESEGGAFQHFHFTKKISSDVIPRKDQDCIECGKVGGRFGTGDARLLPCSE